MKHYCVDTNVVIDMLANRGEFAEAASNLMDAACIYPPCHIRIYITLFDDIWGMRER